MILETFLGCLTFIEFRNLVIRIAKLTTTLHDNQSKLTEEMGC